MGEIWAQNLHELGLKLQKPLQKFDGEQLMAPNFSSCGIYLCQNTTNTVCCSDNASEFRGISFSVIFQVIIGPSTRN